MSQIIKDLSAGPVPPTVATSYTTDVHDNTTAGPGTAIPAANVLQVLGGATTQDNTHGIRTDANPNNGNLLFVELTNRLSGTATTVGAVTGTPITFALGATPASYTFEFLVTGFDTVTPTGTSYWFFCGARTTGAAATSLGSTEDFVEDAALAASDVDISVAANNMSIVVTGVAGKTLHWNVVGYYVKAT